MTIDDNEAEQIFDSVSLNGQLRFSSAVNVVSSEYESDNMLFLLSHDLDNAIFALTAAGILGLQHIWPFCTQEC